MVKRAACALLWLIAVGWAFNFISAYAGVPQVIGTVIAVATAAFVAVDPLHLIWPQVARSTESAGPDALDFGMRIPGQILIPSMIRRLS